ncbi:Methyltransferase domain-containing protein [Granulicella pectinivorans]|uniref:Methyltransferase domain-containing protein n=1 Tax=Granulicella pectinivorans TaxID=474950 RepID=A0A1I6MY51_9BACT|nr:methyltransferase domain-containing protein [Granulicella pectinivorans]SFS20531.1 Methyltransferase domain-containing protein [Granulicella pectinivorans]
MSDATHFDRRGATYDANETHRRILGLLVSAAPLQPGMRVVDVATGTGAAALKAAEIVGPTGSVFGIDLSAGMLAEARRKATEAAFSHVQFLQADAERFDLPAESVDFIFCASGLVMMQDIPAALRRWVGWLKPNGHLAFDVPAKPFGLSEMVAEAAAAQGILLPYDTVADTPTKCRALLEDAGLIATHIATEVVSDDWVELDKAIAFLEERMDHPAWRALQDAPENAREATRNAYAEIIQKRARAHRFQSKVAQHFVYGRKSKRA